MSTRAPGASVRNDDSANSQVITDALALQYAAPLPFDHADAGLLSALSIAWENAASPIRARRLRIIARGFLNALAGFAPLSYTLCDVGDVYQAAMLCPLVELETRRRAWQLAGRMHRAIVARPVSHVVSDALAMRFAITAEGAAELAASPDWIESAPDANPLYDEHERDASDGEG